MQEAPQGMTQGGEQLVVGPTQAGRFHAPQPRASPAV
jgi:hypothetical protein